MNLIKTLFFTLILGALNQETNAQKIDYLDLVNRTALKLEAFDTNVLSKNIQQYYYDLGFAYYVQYGFTNDTNLLRKSIKTYEKALYHNPKYSAALWNIALGYYFLNNCPKSLYYLNRHKKATPKKRWMKDQFISIEKKCGK